jgi:hypothetical protein
MADTIIRKDIIVIDSIKPATDDKGKEYREVVDKSGKIWRVKQGLDGWLKAKWDILMPDFGYEFSIGDWKGNEYVADIARCSDLLKVEDARRKQMAVKDEKAQSIEGQTAVELITQLEIAGKFVNPRLGIARDKWLENALRGFMPDETNTNKPSVKEETPTT